MSKHIDTESLNDAVTREFHAWLDKSDLHAENAMLALLELEATASDILPARQMAAFTDLQDLMAKATGRD